MAVCFSNVFSQSRICILFQEMDIDHVTIRGDDTFNNNLQLAVMHPGRYWNLWAGRMKWLWVNQNSRDYGRIFLRFVLFVVDRLSQGVFWIGCAHNNGFVLHRLFLCICKNPCEEQRSP